MMMQERAYSLYRHQPAAVVGAVRVVRVVRTSPFVGLTYGNGRSFVVGRSHLPVVSENRVGLQPPTRRFGAELYTETRNKLSPNHQTANLS